MYTYYMWTQHSFLRTLGSIIIFNKNDNFGKNSNFRNFENLEKLLFWVEGPMGPQIGPKGPQGSVLVMWDCGEALCLLAVSLPKLL